MKRIAKFEPKHREALFRNTANKMGLTEAIIEKDFWVCWILDYLFHRCRWKDNLAFKGGTSLSKAYGLIERFSEDIDLILDWRVLGYEKDEPWLERSNTKQNSFNKEANTRAEAFLRDTFLPEVLQDLSGELALPIKCSIDEADRQTVKFSYPSSFSDSAILQEIRLEIGALAAWTPAQLQHITPYTAQQYGRLFEQSTTDVLTVLPERTFWEKVTILHREAYRAADREFPSRYSRHYYDLYRMVKTSVKENALADEALLARVVKFKDKFYRCPWACYELAKRGTMRLIPPEYSVDKLYDDYEHMQNMLFGQKPGFDEILDGIKTLETEINAVVPSNPA
ncbi:MAG: nucleotidyl transferase AbiEii/AbiGii toxin family protein [Spirochaetales bacterium]|nr:nucleotidyl transferase AbiEii/AbiGii toxin family protein [Spirochaetales bacterium]